MALATDKPIRLSLLALLVACGSKSPPSAEPLPVSTPVEPAPEPNAPDAPDTPDDGRAAAPTPAPAKPAPTARTGQQFVDAHNRYRAKHCAAPLTWSPKLAEVAQAWANTLRDKGCTFGHSTGNKYGENLAAGTIGALDPESTTAMWYDEVKLYTFPDGGFSMETGHFTQVVWTTTTQIGCGSVECNGNVIYVCNYDPPGNWQGQYAQHVLPTSCKK
jgi:pathogenesis-related protein 1